MSTEIVSQHLREAAALLERVIGDEKLLASVNTAAQLRDRGVAKVTVARALDDAQQQRLSAALTRIAGRPVEMQIDVDPQVIGGARVLLGDQVIEGTVSHKLTELSRHFG